MTFPLWAAILLAVEVSPAALVALRAEAVYDESLRERGDGVQLDLQAEASVAGAT